MFKIREMDWFKRRNPVAQPKAVEVEVIGFEKIDNHKCQVVAKYDNGELLTLSGRINVNILATPNRWTVHGIDSLGHSVMVDLIEK